MKFELESIIHRTPTKSLLIKKLSNSSSVEDIRCNYKQNEDLCKKGCLNYHKKYSCPPYSPPFTNHFKDIKNIVIFCYSIELEQYAPLNHYQRIKASNSVLKSLLDKELRNHIQKGRRVAGSGSCRACKSCGAKQNIPCKKIEKKIYSLEAMGVDVDELVRICFGFNLEWYSKITPTPKTTCVVGAVEIL